MMSAGLHRGAAGVAVAGALGVLMSCSAVRQVVPLEPGESAINVSLGGPITQYIGDAYAPLPFLGVGYNRGIFHWMDVEAGIDVTHLLYKNLSFDLGANFRPVKTNRWRPSVTITPEAHIATNFQTYFRFYPVLCLTGAWNPREGQFHPYLGVENMWELADEREDGLEQQDHWFFVPYGGLVWARTKWQWQLEARWYFPNIDSDYGRAPTNYGPGDHGILGVFLGVGRTFGGRKQSAPSQ